MEQLKLTQQEQVFYGEYFQTCDADGSGKISNSRASELFVCSGLGPEVLLKISELCGAKRLGHFGRSQFYIALKLIAAVQNGYPPKLDSLNTGTEMPLPTFTRTADQEKRIQNAVPSLESERPVQQVGLNHPTVGQLPPPPASKKSHTRSQSGQFRGVMDRDPGPPNPNPIPQGITNQQSLNREESPNNATSPRQFTSPTQSPPSSPPVTNNIQSAGSIPLANHNNVHGQMTSPVAKSLASQSQGAPVVMNAFQTGAPTVITGTAPTTIHTGHHPHPHHHHHRAGSNSSHEPGEGWASFEEDEHAGLLAPGSRKPYNLEPPGFDSSSISSDPESVDDIWSINDDQKEYYIAQFKTMQPDLSKTITGAVAKEFFEKSKLHVHELSKIWQLSDLNRDGELSLEEFCIAMHLVVLRRHEIEIPDRLPFSLMPYTSFTNEEPFAVDHPSGGTLKRATPPDTPPSHPQSIGENWPEQVVQDGSSDTASDVASPSVKPLNFASVPVSESDKIIHPIAMRVSPEIHQHERGRAYSEPAPTHNDQSESSTKKLRSNTESHLSASQNEINLMARDDDVIAGSPPLVPPPTASRPRPVPPKSLGPVPGNISGLLLPAPTSSHPDATDGGVEQEPPVPPPRPTGRSMSMDASKGLSTPPAVPPRASPKDSPAVRKSGDLSFSAINSKFNEFKKFESIPSEESLNKMAGVDSTDSTNHMVRSLSQEYNKMGQVHAAGLESGDSNAVIANTSRESSPLVKFDVPDDEAGGGETQISLEMRRQLSRDKKDLQMAIRTHKERNSTLERLGSELNQELQEVMEQRIALEIQLEHLKPFSS